MAQVQRVDTGDGAANQPGTETAARRLEFGQDFFLGNVNGSRNEAQQRSVENLGAGTGSVDGQHGPRADDRAASVVVLPVVQAAREHFRLLKEWEGVVLSIDQRSEVLSARITDISDPSDQLEVVIPFDNISPADRPLVAEGAVFYWKVGRTIRRGGQLLNQSIVKFRRLPAWQPDELAEAEVRVRELGAMFRSGAD